MIVSHAHRFVFVKTRKTAGTSIEVYLSPHMGPDDVVTPIEPPVEPHAPQNFMGRFNPIPEILAAGRAGGRTPLRDWSERRRYYNHMPAFRVRGRLGASTWRSYFTFCVERNPWDRVLSFWHMERSRRGVQLELDDFLRVGRMPPNLPLYTEPGRPDRIMVDRVIRYESLADELGDVFGKLGIPWAGSLDVRAKSEYRTDRTHYRDVYTPDQRRRVEEIYADEIALLGWEY